ncbi:MAG TPA: nucleotide sugar dehydrogenase [Candidatus Dormibacteraeota bacterium]|nr:nucleotide sugar dehydrogenase [Candidatus Dormibacteraeota bacterium]
MTRQAPNSLVDKLHDRKATVAVVGLGYVGLPLACALAEAGHTVIGIDADTRKVDGINQGRSHIEDIPAQQVETLVKGGRLTATTDYEAARVCDAAIIAVPTPIDEFRVPDLTFVRSASHSLAAVMPKGSLIVLESTTYPGTTEEVVVPALRERGFMPGVDVFIGYSPERIDPGNKTYNIHNTPKVVCGLTKSCTDATIALYGTIVEQLVPVSSIKTAEITKLFENIFRGVNIALVNEFQVICDAFGIDVWEVIHACSTKPYGFTPFYPGPGLGGHCVPVDPFYLAWKARQLGVNTEFIELSGRVNAAMPNYVVLKVMRLLNANHKALNGSRVGLLGVAYKKNSTDVRESPAIKIVELLKQEGATVTYFDPHVPEFEVDGNRLRSQTNLRNFLAAQDCAVVVTDHDAIDWTLVLQHSPMIIDTRNVLGRLSPFAAKPAPGTRGPVTA